MKLSMRTLGIALVAAAVLTGAASCSSSTPAATSAATVSAASSAASTPAPTGTITVFAAASLKSTFTALATSFQAANPGTTVKTNFAGSSDLVTQITGGAPADVFASADTANMTKLTGAAPSLITGTPVNFATNVLEIAVPPGNPAKVTSFQDLGNAAIKTVICAPAVPCGAATVKVETATGVTIPAVSQESSVTDVLGKVSSGEADAGLVYVTDVTAAGGSVQGVTFPESAGVVNTYPIGQVSTSTNPALAQAFIAYVTGPEGQAVLKAAGFGTP